MITSRLAAAIALCTAAMGAAAASPQDAALRIEHARARATVPGQATGGAYLSIANGGSADRLVAASTPVAARAEIHEMRMDGDVMRMRAIEGIDVPARATVQLAPGGLHLMLMALRAPLLPGQRFPLTLQFRDAGAVTVQVQVEARPQPGGGHRH